MKKGINCKIENFEELVKSNLCMMHFARGCNNKRFARGLCPKHYQIIRRCVNKGILTWDKIEIQLKALTSKYESSKSILKDLRVKD